MTDSIDIRQVRFYAPVPVHDYAATVDLLGAEFAPGDTQGVKLLFDRAVVNARWPDFRVPGWSGDLQWTLFAGFEVDGQWWMGGFHEFWGSRGGGPREWTGAHPAVTVNGKTHWQANWAYDANRFGELSSVAPREGQAIALMMVAGGARPGTSNHVTVPERSNIIVVPLRLSGVEMASQPVPTPEPIPAPVPVPVSVPVVPDIQALLERIAKASESNADLQRDTLRTLKALLKELGSQV